MWNLIKAYLGIRTVRSSICEGNRTEKWLTDIKFVEDELPKRHKNLFFELSEASFYRQIKHIRSNIENLSDDEIKVLLFELVAGIKDGHSVLYLKHKNQYPLRFYYFDDGIYLTQSTDEYAEFIGSELIAIGGHDITEVANRLTKCVSADNHQQFKNRFSNYLVVPEILKGLGLANDQAEFTFKNDRQIFSIILEPCPIDTLELKLISNMLHLSNQTKNYWYQLNNKENYVYFQYNSCMKDNTQSFKAFNKEMFQAIDKNNIQQIIVDMRHNGGGASWIINPFFRALRKRPHLNNPKKLFVIIGRQTFSSALMNTIRFMKKTNATLAGEETGGAPNGYGEIMFLKLMNANIQVVYSTQYFKQLDEELNCIEPAIKVPNLSKNYFEDRDCVLIEIEKAIKSRDTEEIKEYTN